MYYKQMNFKVRIHWADDGTQQDDVIMWIEESDNPEPLHVETEVSTFEESMKDQVKEISDDYDRPVEDLELIDWWADDVRG